MTVNTTTNKNTQTGNGVTTVFSFPYPFIAASDVQVYVNGVLKVLNTDYTIPVATSYPTGANVTFTVAPALNAVILMVRVRPFTQTLDLVANDPLPADQMELLFGDHIVMLCQQLNETLSRSFTLSVTDTSGASTTIPTPQALAFIGWNATATGLQNYTAMLGTTPITSYWASVVASSSDVHFDGGVAGGAANALTCAVSPSPAAYARGQIYIIKASNNNSGPATLADGAKAATAIRLNSTTGLTALVGGEIVAGQTYIFVYDGTFMVLINPSVVAVDPNALVHGECVLQKTNATTVTLLPKNGNRINVNGVNCTIPAAGVACTVPTLIASSTRARNSNVATIVTAAPHGLSSNAWIRTQNFGAAAYNTFNNTNSVAAVTGPEWFQITVINSTTFTYVNTGANEGTTADTTGRIEYYGHFFVTASAGIVNALLFADNGTAQHSTSSTNGVEIRTGTPAQTYVGSGIVYNNAGTANWEDSQSNNFLISHFNKRVKSGIGKQTVAGTANGSTTYIEADAKLRTRFISDGVNEVEMYTNGQVSNTAAGQASFIGLNVDGSGATVEDNYSYATSYAAGNRNQGYSRPPGKVIAEGPHYIAVMQKCSGGNTTVGPDYPDPVFSGNVKIMG